MSQVREDVNVRHIYPSRYRAYIWKGLAILVVGLGLWMYIAWGLAEIEAKAKIEELKGRSPAHFQILNSYYECIGPRRSPGHMACLGSVAKAAELYGYKSSVISKVFIEAGLLPAPDAINPVSPAHH